MPRFLLAALALLLMAPLARGDVFTLKDGTTLEGTVVGSTDDAYLVKLADGSQKRVLKDAVKKREWKEAPPPPAVTPPVEAPGPQKAPELTAEERLAALKKSARDGLGLRSRLVVGARELTTAVPIKVEGGYALSTQPRKLELDQASYVDRSVDELARDLWDRRAKPADERFKALKAVAGTIAWTEAEVLSVATAGDVQEVVLDLRSVALRGKTRIRLQEPVAPHAILKLPVVLLVRPDEGAQFLAGQMGETVSVWPVDFVLLAAEVTTGARIPRTVASDLALRVGERTVADAVKEWYTSRCRIQCSACKGLRKCICPECNGAGGFWKQYIDVTGGSSGMGWYTCGRCKGLGTHTCNLCKDGLDEVVLKNALKRFGTYGKPLGGWLAEGQKVEVDKDGKQAKVTTWIREKPTDQPRPETTSWTFDEKTSSWRPAG